MIDSVTASAYAILILTQFQLSQDFQNVIFSDMISILKNMRSLSTQQTTPIGYFLRDLTNRKLIVNTHPMFLFEGQDLDSYASSLPNVLYTGFDPTSDSFHIGNLFILSTLIRSATFKCTPIILIGEATALVGDPSGHSEDRKQLSHHIIHQNTRSLIAQIERIIANAKSLCKSPLHIKVLNNMAWYKELKMLDFMVLSKRFRIGEMLRLGPIKSRLEEGSTLSFSEFSYQILQANDWLTLSKMHDCYCGSDQLGNFKTGFEHIRAIDGRQSLGVCLPLLTDEFGRKLGKSTIQQTEEGAGQNKSFWLCPKKTSPFAFYQYFRQLHAEDFLVRFSLKPYEEIEELLKLHNSQIGKWIAQTHLAEEMTSLVHGHAGLQLAKRCSSILYDGSINDLEELDADTIKDLFGSASTHKIPKSSIKTMGQIAEATRKGGGKTMRTGAFRINGVKMENPDQNVELKQILIQNQFTLVCWGKRKFSLILWTE